MDSWRGGKKERSLSRKPRIPQCGHLQVQTGERTDRFEAGWIKVTQEERALGSEMNPENSLLLQPVLSH